MPVLFLLTRAFCTGEASAQATLYKCSRKFDSCPLHSPLFSMAAKRDCRRDNVHSTAILWLLALRLDLAGDGALFNLLTGSYRKFRLLGFPISLGTGGMPMYHRWVWPLVASVTAITIITLDFFLTSAAVRAGILSGVAVFGITAFVCLVSMQYLPTITPKLVGIKASPGDGKMHISLEVRGKPAAKPSDEKSQKDFEGRAQEAYEFACCVLTMTAHEPGSVSKLLAERDLMLAKYQHIELENEQLREQVERLLPDLTRAVKEAGSVIRAREHARAATSPTSERRPKKQKTPKEKAARTTTAEYPPDGFCQWCEQYNRRLVHVYHVQRADVDEPGDINVCRGSCESSSILRGRGSLTPPGTDPGTSDELQVELETAEAS